MIRWERQQDGNWLGLSGELLVATVAKQAAEKEQWLWTITALALAATPESQLG